MHIPGTAEDATTRMRQLEVFDSLLPDLKDALLNVRSVEDSWQPSDLLPNFGCDGWQDDLDQLRTEAASLTDEMLVVLVGNVVTEEALPSYQTALSRFGGLSNKSGIDDGSWAQWTRAWTAEEKRHGDVTRAYLYLTGRVNMRSIEQTIQHLLRNGFDTGAAGDPYFGLSYVSIQEHATKTSWRQLGTIVKRAGARRLHKMCGLIAADEARHERMYRMVMRGVLDRDPDGSLAAMHESLGNVVMPAKLMCDGHSRQLFQRFADVGQRLGVYDLRDYADNIDGFIAELELESLEGLRGAANRHRDEICMMPDRYRRHADFMAKTRVRTSPFRWIHDRRV